MTSPEPTEPMPRPGAAAFLSLGVIVWSDDPEVDPTVIADRNPVTLARSVALTIHDMLTDADLYAGAAEFVETLPPPQDWVWPEDVDDWLEALRESTPYPAYSFHRVPVSGGVDGTNHTAVARHLEDALRAREQALTGEPAEAPAPPPAAGRELGR
ncbi:hypothetical protein D3248_04395 [Leucobacter zeae]|nr:hypothetical protein [Leucobacter zeae]